MKTTDAAIKLWRDYQTALECHGDVPYTADMFSISRN